VRTVGQQIKNTIQRTVVETVIAKWFITRVNPMKATLRQRAYICDILNKKHSYGEGKVNWDQLCDLDADTAGEVIHNLLSPLSEQMALSQLKHLKVI